MKNCLSGEQTIDTDGSVYSLNTGVFKEYWGELIEVHPITQWEAGSPFTNTFLKSLEMCLFIVIRGEQLILQKEKETALPGE